MVEERKTFLIYCPLAAGGFALLRASIKAWKFSISKFSEKLTLPRGACTLAPLSTLNSILPALYSLMALARSKVTVPVLGLGISPLGPSSLPSLPSRDITSGVAMATSKSSHPS